jgi:hypothetical protein
MRKFILISAWLAALGLLGCQSEPNPVYTIYVPSMDGTITAVPFASPYDDPGFYRGGGR